MSSEMLVRAGTWRAMGSWSAEGCEVSTAVLLASFFLIGESAEASPLELWWRCGLAVRSMRSGWVWNGCGFMLMAR